MKQRRVFLAACAAAFLGLSGCAVTGPYGSFLNKDDAPAPLDGIAADAVRKLAGTWLPAKTRLAMQHPSADPFGVVLVGTLRSQGYSVLEYTAPGKAKPANDATNDAAPEAVSVATVPVVDDSLPVSYVLDRAGDFYRLKLLAGRHTLSRAYVVNAGKFAPAGAWSLRLE